MFPAEGSTDADMARNHTRLFRAAIAGAGVVPADERMTGTHGDAADPAPILRPARADLVGLGNPRRPPSGPPSRG